MTKQNPYVLSEDVYALMKIWSREKNRKIPSAEYFEDNTRAITMLLRTSFSEVAVVASGELMAFFQSNIRSGDTVVSLDRAYAPLLENLKGAITLDDCRGLDTQGSPITLQRPETPVPARFLDRKAKKIKLVDDVVFDGNSLSAVCARIGPDRISSILVGVATRHGKERLENELNVPVKAAYVFDTLIDEVCERDFCIGTPLCGRPVFAGDQNQFFLGSRPYVWPFGDPVGWGSIPASEASVFSRECRGLSQDLWQEVGRLNKTEICNRDLPRPVFGIAYNAAVAQALRNA